MPALAPRLSSAAKRLLAAPHTRPAALQLGCRSGRQPCASLLALRRWVLALHECIHKA